MVEVFKTNVRKKVQCKMLESAMSKIFPLYTISFDLLDCDKVLRVEGEQVVASKVASLISEYGFICELLD